MIRHTGAPDGDSAYFKLLIEEANQDSFENTVLELDFDGMGPGMTITLDAWVSTKENLKDLEPTAFVIVDDDPLTTTYEGMDESAGNVLTNAQLAFEGGDDGDSLIMTVTAENNSVGVLMDLGDVYAEDDDTETTTVTK